MRTTLAGLSIFLANSLLLSGCDGGASTDDEASSQAEIGDGDGDGDGDGESETTDSGPPDLPAGCEQPTTLPSALTLTGEFPSDPWSGGCSLGQASVSAGTLTLAMTCTEGESEFPLTLTVPAEAAPSGVNSGSSVGVTYAGDHSDEFLPVQRIEVDDIDGLVLGSVETGLQEVVLGSITLSVASECAEVSDPDSLVAIAAGHVHAATSLTEIDIAVGEVGTIAFGLEWDIHVTEASAIQCCHGNQVSATIVRR